MTTTAMNQDRLNILLVEDDASVRDSVAMVLRDEGHEVRTAADGREAIASFPPDTDLVISDVNMPNVDGRQLLDWVRGHHPETEMVLLTGFGTIPKAVEAIKAGAMAYLTKPPNPQELLSHVGRCMQVARLRRQAREASHYKRLVGRSPLMQKVFAVIDRVAEVKTTVLIIGESGTGKEMVARALHDAGPRRDGPFLAINCGAIPESLIESTLFGHEKGAFTGAEKQQRGYFQAANGGTLLLDEIGELPPGLQSKLLRVLEDGMVTPVGTTAPQKVDVRIVAATNRDLEAEVRAGKFRQDLFFRLNVVRIDLPSLRQRPEDLPLLTRYLLDEICRTNGFEPRKIDPSLLEALAQYDWPGNVRELRNVLESVVVLSGKNTLTADDLPERIRRPRIQADSDDDQQAEADDDLNLNRLSRQMILKALESCGGNRTEAAKQLGISRRTLHRRLNEFGLREG